MKSLQTLIKLHNNELDEIRRKLKEAQEQLDLFKAIKRQMQEDLDAEYEFASTAPDMAMTFANYRQKMNERLKNAEQTINSIDREVQRITNQIALKFGEVKKYEIVLENKINHLLKEEKDKETATLDEIAMQKFIQED